LEELERTAREVESLKTRAVVVLPGDRRVPEECLDACAGIERRQVAHERVRGIARRTHGGPVLNEAAEDPGLATLHHLLPEALGCEFAAIDLFGRQTHGRTADFAAGRKYQPTAGACAPARPSVALRMRLFFLRARIGNCLSEAIIR